MKHFKNIALILVVCMLVSVVSVAAAVLPDGGAVTLADDVTVSPVPDAEPSAEPSEAPQPSVEPSTEPSAETSAEPSESAEPTESQSPDASASPEPFESASPSAEPSNKPGSKHNITVNNAANSEITVTPKTAAVNARIKVEGKADRGYGFDKVYYTYIEEAAEKQETLLSKKANAMTDTFTMPDADVNIYSEVSELTDSEVLDDAETQIDDVKSLNNSYTSIYLNNSSDYNSTDIKNMRSYINEAKDLVSSLETSSKELSQAIDSSDLTGQIRAEVISLQTDLDAVTEEMIDLSDEMGGENVDMFDMNISVGKGGRVIISGLISDTINATSARQNEVYDDISVDDSTNLSFTITATAGYSISSFKINNKSVSYTGNRFTIKAASIGNYVKGGNMDVNITFGYTGFSSGSGGSSGGGGGMTAGGGSSNNNNVTGGNTGSGITAGDVFSDIGTVEWAREAIEKLNSLGIVSGVGDGQFAPNSDVTREQFAKMIVGVMGYTVDSNAVTDFSDANGGWYTPYIAAAVQNGVITGRGDGTFGVGDNITRQDMAVIIYRALGLSAGETHEFTDSADIADYALDAVSALFNTGIIGGYPDGSFAPKASASRAEAAKMLYSVYDNVH